MAALVAAGIRLFPINPRIAARYRERHAQAGGDPTAVMLANILRTDRHAHRPLPADIELARAIKATGKRFGFASRRPTGCSLCCATTTPKPW